MKEISGITMKSLNNGAHFLYVKRILERAENDKSVNTKAAKYVTALKTALDKEDEYLKLSQKSLLTDKITEADSNRDALYSSYRKAVKSFLDFPVADMAEAAKVLNQHLIDYAIDPRAQLDKETGLLLNLLTDLEGKYKTQVEKLGLTPLVTSLKEANDQVYSLTEQRTNERMTQNVGALRAARLEVDDAYRLLIKMVNSLIMVEESTDYDDFADYVNTQITHYKREAIGTKATSAQTTTKPSTDGTSGGSSESSGSSDKSDKSDTSDKSEGGGSSSGGDSGSSGDGSLV